MPTRLGAYSFKAAVLAKSIDGRAGPVFEVCDLRSDYESDGELATTLEQLADIAKAHGSSALQLSEWRNIHEARWFRKLGTYSETTTLHVRAKSGYTDELPNFVRPLVVTAPRLDTSELERFLSAGYTRGIVTIGPFRNTAFRRGICASAGTDKALTIADINSDKPGSGLYPSLLNDVASAARKSGCTHLVIADVSNRRHFAFYENRMGFTRLKSNDACRSYALSL